ncbi:MAG TPA: exo-beta-N-acetylmuramidase NamZ domain-containing protein [Pyrinomonadaceae bacterium]|nr:exo-beta-N-acetylmuramidase NamZ domain-containing protein [Pyrinomonadaceae bacterium]
MKANSILKVQSSKFKVGGRWSVGFLLFLLAAHCSPLTAQSLPLAAPQTVGMSAAKLNQIDALVTKDIADKKLPGAVVIVGHKGKIVFRKAFGNRSLVPTIEKMTVDTIFDAASLTKPIATATSIMILVERGQLRLNDTIGKFIPEIQDENAKRITIQQLLTHVSGYQPDFDLRKKWEGNDSMLKELAVEPLRQPSGTKFVYSDIGFIVLGEIILRISGKSVAAFAKENIFNQLTATDSSFSSLSGMTHSGLFNKRGRIAPTENVRGQQSYLGANFSGRDLDGNTMLSGQVHDPTAYRMGGIAGHAGLFSTGDDLARYCQMLLNGGTLDGKRILSAQTVARMTAPIVVSEDGATRGLGWDMNTSFSSNRGELFPLGSFGHTGFTGTSVWIDRVSQTFVVFLSNRVHPDGKGDVTSTRAKVATVAASAVEDTPIEMTRLAEDIYSSQVAAQIPKFKNQSQNQPTTDNRQLTTSVLNGIDVLEKNNFKELNNLRIGLVTNHTGRNLSGKPTIDVLKNAPNVKLVALFSPEHGIRGELDEEGIKDSVDSKTGLPVYSLYGETRRPKPEQLKDLDAIVYDIQDIGARFYTYTATLRNVLEEAAKAGKPVYVLDRPNPINGVDVEGSLAEESKLSFIAAHTIPVRYGLTIGELGMMMNAERKIGADLKVIKMENWQRSMWFDQTNQTWINPSPNMRSLTEATLYPGIGLLETTNVSVGRGTDTPFEVVGAPWLDGRQLATYLNARNLGGVRFVPVKFKPDASVFKNEDVGGINVVITDRARFQSVKTGIEIAVALRKLYPNDWQADKFLRLLVNADVLEKVKRADAPEDIEKSWQNGLAAFSKRRALFLLYK